MCRLLDILVKNNLSDAEGFILYKCPVKLGEKRVVQMGTVV